MKCHYEILEISRNADESEIKSAYRKQALKWHPDKNLDNSNLAKEQFQLVQQAYEILSDKQERAWYDAHRDQILKGSNSEFQDKSLDVFQYFTTTCFNDYGDDETGFYTVYRNVFHQIAKEDIEFIEEKEEFVEIPEFGNSDSDYEEVVKHFYDYWMSYSTKKSYSWLDPYDVREGKGDRRISKLIEKENQKARQKFRKERNEEIRNLVAFVRKRDKRVLAYIKEMQERTIENRQKQKVLSKQKRLERSKQHANEKQGEWMMFDNVKSELEEMEKHLAQEFGEDLTSSDEEVQDLNNLYCIACNKVYKNPKAFENHELSKKHKENVEKLKEIMLEEDSQSNLSNSLEDFNDIKDVDEDIEEKFTYTESVSEDEYLQNNESNLKEIGGKPEEINGNLLKKSKKKKSRNVLNIDEHSIEEGESIQLDISDHEFDFGVSKSRKKKNIKRNNINKSKQNDSIDQMSSEVPEPESSVSKVVASRDNRKDRKKNKKDKVVTEVSDIDTNHCCVTCKGNFPTKNKLFDHLKKTGHGVYLPPKIKQNKKTRAQYEI